MASLPVIRAGGKFGNVAVSFVTAPLTALEGIDYVATSGDLALANGVESSLINVTLKDDVLMEQAETFKVILTNITGWSISNTRQHQSLYL